MKKIFMTITAAAFATVSSFVVAPQAEAAAWSKCQACHDFSPKNKVGPGLGKGMVDGKMEPGVFMREAGTHPDFRYQFTKYIPDGKSWKWDEAHLRQWMCDSKKAIKEFTGDSHARTKMLAVHICDKAEQDEVIAKMKEISGAQ